MAPGGWLYTITDVPELGEWMVRGRPSGVPSALPAGRPLHNALARCHQPSPLPLPPARQATLRPPPPSQRSKLEAHPLFEAIPEAEVDADPAARLLAEATEEGQKVARNSGRTFRAVFRRRADPPSTD